MPAVSGTVALPGTTFSENSNTGLIITAGLLYAVDIREVENPNPIFGIVPRRLVGLLVISFVCAFGMMFLWGRLQEGNPTALESFGRATVNWVSTALGAVLADILPGEGKGEDSSELLTDQD